MKALTLIITMILAQQVFANNSCFDTQAVKDLIEASEELDECFKNDASKCKSDIGKLSVEAQREVNSQRLIPYDRSKNELMNKATGAVSAQFTDGTSAASGQKISSCHIITSAHLLYGSTDIPVDSQDKPALKDSEHFDVNFHSGQTCDSEMFENKAGAQVFFKMTKENTDFVCEKKDLNGNCLSRRFYGKSDLVILKLKNYDKKDNNFFKLKTTQITTSSSGNRVNCWGYPEYNNQTKLSKTISDRVLWHQKDAKIFAGETAKGVLTNAISYPGMSGGGCVSEAKPNELVGVFADKNSATGHAAVDVSARTADVKGANYISSFQNLAERYKQSTGKDIADLDSECE